MHQYISKWKLFHAKFPFHFSELNFVTKCTPICTDIDYFIMVLETTLGPVFFWKSYPMDQSTINSIYFLLVQSLIALTDGKHCQDCLSSIRFKLNPLYWPNKSLEYGSEKYFGPTSLKKHLLETGMDCNVLCSFIVITNIYGYYC